MKRWWVVAVALLSIVPIPAREGWLFEHLLRDPDAPNGTAELLVHHAMLLLAVDGVSWVTLGLAPLAGPVSGWLRTMRSWSRPLFNFDGLAAFKRKLRPQGWEPIYLAYPREQSSARAMLDGLRGFAGGSLWRFGVRKLRRDVDLAERAGIFGLGRRVLDVESVSQPLESWTTAQEARQPMARAARRPRRASD